MAHIRGHQVSPNFAALMGGREPTMLPGQQFLPARPGGANAIQQLVNPLPGTSLAPVPGAGQVQTLGNPLPGQPQQALTPIPGAIQPGVPTAQPPLALPQTLTNLPVVQQPGTGQALPIPQAPVPVTEAVVPTVPLTGLSGFESAIQQGLGASTNVLEQTFGQAGEAIGGGTLQALDLLRQAQQPLQPFQQGGAQAQQLQLAQSGALGPEAQQAAFDAFTASPGQRFLQEEAERALTRNAAALGGLGGGNLRRDLVRQAVGFGQQDFSNQFDRLSQLAGQGLTAAGGLGQLGAAGAGVAQQGGLSQADLLATGGLAASGQFQQAGRDIGQQRFQTGRDIAQAVSGTVSALSALAETQGAGLADITGAGGVNIANLLSGFGQLDAAGQQALATILANLATGQGTQQAQLEAGIGEATAGGIVGEAAGFRAGTEQLANIFI